MLSLHHFGETTGYLQKQQTPFLAHSAHQYPFDDWNRHGVLSFSR